MKKITPSAESAPSKDASLLTTLMVVSMVIWGGSWVSAKAIANTLPSESLTFWRFLANFVSLIPALFFVKEPVRMSGKAWLYTVLGSVFLGLYLYLFFKGLKYGLAGAAGVLVTTTVPIMTFVLSAVFLRGRIYGKDVFGLILGAIGGGTLLGAWTLDLSAILLGGNIYFLVCAVLWALLTICSQKAGALVSPIVFSLLTNAFCTALFFFLALPYGIMDAFKEGPLFWFNIFYLGVISSAFATTVYFYASARLDSNRASSFVFLVPLSAVLFSWAFLNEVPRITTIAGGSLAIAAVYLINKKGNG